MANHQQKIIIYPSILVERIEPTTSSTMNASGSSSTPKASSRPATPPTNPPTNSPATPSPPLQRKAPKLRSPIKTMKDLDDISAEWKVAGGPEWQLVGRRRGSSRRLDLNSVDEFPPLSLSRSDSSAASSNGDPYKKDVDKAVR